MDKTLTNKSKEISYALRHKPEEYGLVLDVSGRVLLTDLIDAINFKHYTDYLTREDITAIIACSDKARFEIIEDGNDEYIRAMYGHSTKTVEIEYVESQPPNNLYHGTTVAAYESIKNSGIKKMNRQYVHLSETIDMANVVAKRHKNSTPLILFVDAYKMRKDGIVFYKGNDDVWLTDFVDPKYITVLKTKQRICDELNKIIDESVNAAYKLLDSNNMHLGFLNSLYLYKAPDDGTTRLTLDEMLKCSRLTVLSHLWSECCEKRISAPCTLEFLHSDQEVQAEYDRQKQLELDVYSSDEYKQYLKLKAKFDKIETDSIRNSIAKGIDC